MIDKLKVYVQHNGYKDPKQHIYVFVKSQNTEKKIFFKLPEERKMVTKDQKTERFLLLSSNAGY